VKEELIISVGAPGFTVTVFGRTVLMRSLKSPAVGSFGGVVHAAIAIKVAKIRILMGS
jgi:hypothetical protein